MFSNTAFIKQFGHKSAGHSNHVKTNASFLQILSTKQWARIIVHAYPYLPTVEQSLQAFAEFETSKSFMSTTDILKAAETDSMETAWQALQLQEYIELNGEKNTHNYLPLSSCPSFKSKAQPASAARAIMPFGTEVDINLHYNI